MTDESSFEPKDVIISPADTVRWRNVSNVGHTVTAYEEKLPIRADYFASGGFRSEQVAQQNLSDGFIAPGEQFEHMFNVSGVYEYYCIPHEGAGMIGSVRVR
jgi:plastocyanin